MDQVPLAFCEHLCDILSIDAVKLAGELSSYYGELAQNATEYRAMYCVAVRKGIQGYSYLQYDRSNLEYRTVSGQVEDISKKYIRNVSIFLQDAENTNVSGELVRRYPNAYFHFSIGSSSINEAWVDLAYSLKRLGSVLLKKELDDEAFRLFQKLVEGWKLSSLITTGSAFQGNIVDMAKWLFLQDQFDVLEISNYDGQWNDAGGLKLASSVCELLDFWLQNSERLKGKSLVVSRDCYGAVQQLEKFVRRGTATLCEKEESKFRDKEHSKIANFKPLYVYRYEEGEESDKRKFYISFKCTQHEKFYSKPTGTVQVAVNAESHVLGWLHCSCHCQKYLRLTFA
uniref:TIR domain-containing protein n=1 Tax=Steinernema glaseri TaxID=37863 RepID=A0A1I7XYX0_9BILA